MYKYSSEEINHHRLVRNEHENETDKMFAEWIEKNFSNRYIVNRTAEFDRYDYLIYDSIKHSYCKVESKVRNFTIDKYNKYKDEGFALSYDKINTCDVIIYFIPITNEVLQIRTSKIKELLNENKIRIVQKYVNRYQYTKYKEKHDETLLIIPYEYWKVYQM